MRSGELREWIRLAVVTQAETDNLLLGVITAIYFTHRKIDIFAAGITNVRRALIIPARACVSG